ncbi:MAG: 50S ribosomal protein L10 [Candidatus Kapabacteria bacterium]|jgi:large subunit ribosomal protein L10|nr:50S ribosomal protein L10 [Candidatus Kapabacteria bacterium]
MITPAKKRETVAVLAEKFKNADCVYLVNFERMTVKETIDFRRKLKAKSIIMQVAKNTLIKIAAKESGKFEFPEDVYVGQSAIIFGGENASEPAKIIKESFDKVERPVFKAAIIEGVVYDSTKLNVLSTLPTKEDIISGILSSLNSPISGIVGTVNAVLRDLGSVIEESAKKNVA